MGRFKLDKKLERTRFVMTCMFVDNNTAIFNTRLHFKFMFREVVIFEDEKSRGLKVLAHSSLD